MEEEQEFITIDETDCDTTEYELYSSKNSSKRKAEESEPELIVSHHPSKKKRQHSRSSKTSCEVPFISVQFVSQAVARQFSDELTRFITELTKASISTTVVKDGYACLEFFKAPAHDKDDDVQVLEDDGLSYVDMPKYDQTFNGAVGSSTGEKKEEKAPRPKNTCFNCEGDHMMTACPEPRDSEAIAKNRRKHQSNTQSYSRYHEEAEQRFGHLRPGALSDGLRQALGLEESDLPPHIYRMRVLGYPPGWLRAARQQGSSIAVLHDPKPEKEARSHKNESVLYDHSKLISYPGFNVRDRDATDLAQRYGFPPMQFYQSLLKMKRELPTKVHNAPERAAPDPLCPTAADMDVVCIDDDGQPKSVNGDAVPLKEVGPVRRSVEEVLEDGECADSDADTKPSDEGGTETEEEEPPLVRAPEPAAHSTPLALTPGESRHRELGTPVSAAASSRLLPDADKWAAGITEHLPFENLPGATGAWTRMSDLIKRVRSRVSSDGK